LAFIFSKNGFYNIDYQVFMSLYCLTFTISKGMAQKLFHGVKIAVAGTTFFLIRVTVQYFSRFGFGEIFTPQE
jgi:hypothetical protein